MTSGGEDLAEAPRAGCDPPGGAGCAKVRADPVPLGHEARSTMMATTTMMIPRTLLDMVLL